MSKLIRKYASVSDLPATDDGAFGSVAGVLYTREAGAWIPAGPFPAEAGGTTFALSGAYIPFKAFTGYAGNNAGTDYLCGYWWSPGKNRTLATLGCWLNAGVANAVGRIAIWDTGANGYPTSLVGYSAQLDLSSGTLKTAAPVAPLTVTAHHNYFVALQVGGATPSVMTASASGPFFFIGGTTPTNPRIGLIGAQAFGAAPPTSFPAGFGNSNFFHAPIMFFSE